MPLLTGFIPTNAKALKNRNLYIYNKYKTNLKGIYKYMFWSKMAVGMEAVINRKSGYD
jgi:hypothetical protein